MNMNIEGEDNGCSLRHGEVQCAETGLVGQGEVEGGRTRKEVGGIKVGKYQRRKVGQELGGGIGSGNGKV